MARIVSVLNSGMKLLSVSCKSSEERRNTIEFVFRFTASLLLEHLNKKDLDTQNTGLQSGRS
jgi:hypothetical protein